MKSPPSKSNNTETEEETIAFNRKRARRVSFADNEITSVHIFRPDDDHSSSSSDIPADTLGFFRKIGGDSDDEVEPRQNPTDDAAEVVDHRNSFLQPIGSPSPGGSSNNADDDSDDDEFRGPVSTDFIKPERLSDSGVSDDITMDSTAFSMHYRSLARSDSGDLKTPTRFEATVTTAVQSSATSGSLMDFTDGDKKTPQSPVVASASGDSDAMSIEGEQGRKTHDYGRLSPKLVAILAQGSKDLDGVSLLGSKATQSPNGNDIEVLPDLACSANSPVRRITLDSAIASASESSTKNTKEFVNDATPLAFKQLSSAKANRRTPPKMDKGDKLATDSPIAVHVEVLPTMESSVNSPVHQITPVASASKSSTKNREFVNDATPLSFKQLDSSKANRGTPPKMDEGDKLDLAAKYELGFCEVPIKESNSKDRGHVTDSNHKSDQVTGNHPVHEFTPLSLSANKVVFMGSSDSFRCTGNITPPLKQSGLLVPEVHVENSATLLSIHKSISKLKTLKATPNTSTLKEGTDKLKLRFSKYSPGTSFFGERDFENKQVETLTAPLVEEPFSLTLENNMNRSFINTDDRVVDSLISANVSYNDENLEPVIGASSLLKTRITRVADFDLADGTVEEKNEVLTTTHAKPFASPVKSFGHTLSPSVECQSNCHVELKQTDMQNESFNGGLGQAIEYDKPTAAKKLDLSGDGNSEQPNSPFEDAQVSKLIKSTLKGKPPRSPCNRFLDLSSPIQELTTVLPSLQEPPSDIRDLSHRINSDGNGVDLDNNGYPAPQVAQSPLTETGIKVSSGKKMKGVDLDNNFHPALQVAQSPFTKTGIEVSSGKKRKGVEFLSDIRDLSHRINSDGGGVNLDKNCHPTLQVAQSPLTKTGIEVSSGKKWESVDLDNNCHPTLQVARSPLTKSGIEVSSGKKRKGVELLSNFRDLSHRINSDGHGGDLDNICHPALQVAQSPLTKNGIEVSSEKKMKGVKLLSDFQDLSRRINSDGHVVDLDNNCHPALQVAQSPLTKTGIEISSGKKGKGVELLSDGDNIEKTGRTDRNPEVHKSGDGDLQFVLEQTGSMGSEREKFGDQKWDDLDHVIKKFSTSTKQLLSPSFDKLNLRLIGTLEDILVHLQKVKKWDILSSEIHSQKKLMDPLNIRRRKRIVEMKMLLFNIAYEKSKLQLMNAKRERLLKKVQQLSSGLQETQMIKNSMSCSAKSRPVDIQADGSHINTRFFNSQGKSQVSCKKVIEMRQELESLDQKAKPLSEFFYSYCKMEGDQSYTNVIKSVPGYLEKIMSYKLEFQNLKLWDIEDFERKDDHHMIILNYCGYIIQRLTVNAGLSSIIVSNCLNDANIGKFSDLSEYGCFLCICVCLKSTYH
ncbi:uncharacterized protein [Medicago truncatula]|uniref:uncharacterized protein isoform X3 n=1 Tax=Medicago truncatula TaxID=3880 RepID=UPI000D2F2FB6|nr:uncharacterized protein LOC112420405 isoform X3 [Medicago truncatula]